jgi:site-specific DNA recombinase
MKAFLIARVSTIDQIEALPAQKYRLTDYANRHFPDYELIEFQESAYKGTREKFRQIISRLESSLEPVAVVFDKVDRFTRDSSAEETSMLKNLCRSGRVELHFPSDNLIVHKDSPSTDKMRLGLNTIFAEYYSDAISDNVKRRNEQLRRDGIWTGKAPFGYTNVELLNGKKWIKVETRKAEAVKTAYELYGSGSYSLKTLSRKIAEQYGYELKVNQWDKILRNPFYGGSMLVKGRLFEHKYDHIVTQRHYDLVQAIRDGYAIKPKRWAGLPYPYRGLISCKDCGSRITFEKKKGKYIYGHCTQFKGKHGAAYVNQDDLTEQLESVFNQVQMPEEAYLEVSQALQKSDEQSKRHNAEMAKALNDETAETNAKISRNYEAFLDGMITQEMYKKKHEELTENLKRLSQSRENIELMSNDIFGSISHLLQLSRNAPALFKNGDIEDKRNLLNLVLSNLELEDKELRWKLKEPYDCMALCNENGNWLGRRDSNPRMPGPKPGALPLGDAL